MRVTLLSLVASLALVACSGNTVTQASAGAGGGSSTSSSTGGAGTGGKGSSSTTTSTSSGGTGGGTFTPGTPITAPDSAWTWVPFANAFCGDGSTWASA